MTAYLGLIEVGFTFAAVTAFVIWQIRSLKRDVRAREERERAEAKKAETED